MWALFAVAAAALVLFILSQRRGDRRGGSPLLPMRLFGDRGFAAGSVVQLVNYLGWGSFALMIPLYIQDGLHDSPRRAGLTMLPVTVGSFVGTALAGAAARSSPSPSPRQPPSPFPGTAPRRPAPTANRRQCPKPPAPD